MGSKMLIDASQREEIRVVVARGTRIEEFDFESASRKPLKGNIYLAKVTRVEPSLQAAFVEYGGNRHGFLAFAEIHPDYYQIPIADRQALLREQEEDAAAEDEDDLEEGENTESQHERGRSPRGRGRNRKISEQPESDESQKLEGQTESEQGASGDAAQPDSSETELPSDTPEIAPEDDPPAMALEAEDPPAIRSHVVDEAIESEEPAAEPAEYGNGEGDGGDVITIDEDAEAEKVESIGAEDALEEVPQRRERRTPRRRHYKIQEVIKRRQILLVQVVKEERGNKGAALTTYLSLAGRYCVLMPNTARGGGISRKITDAGDRRRLKEVAREVEVPQGMGLIVRTAGAQRTRPEIKRDFDYLLRLWESVRDLTLKSQAPSLVYEEGSLIKRAIRDLYTKEVDEVIVAGEEAHREAKDFMKMLMPSHAKNVKLYNDPKPLFSKFQVENHLDALFSPTVTLPSGGYLVINQTEALVSIDINSGKATREHSIEDTALKTNLEACDEIARQLRLRDLAGLVVIDFIDMEESRNNRSVERRLKEALKHDRARIQVGRISHFGLLEMSRQRLRPGLIEGTFRTCPYCEGRGVVRSVPSCGLGVLRQIEDSLMKRSEDLTVTCARDVASYLLNEKRDSLLSLEQTYGVTIFVVPSLHEMKGTQAIIERAQDREHAPRRIIASSPVRIDSAFTPDDESESGSAEHEAAEGAETEDLSSEDSGENQAGDRDGEQRAGGRRRRRRGRRGGRRDRGHDDGQRVEQSEFAASVQADGEADTGDSADQDRANSFSSEADQREDQSHEPSETASSEGEQGDDEDRPRRRRDRFGRNRARRGESNDRSERHDRRNGGEGGDRPPRGDRAPHGDRLDRDERRDREYRRPELVERPPQPQIIIPDVIPDPEPRKWQPPAPTVQAEVTEKKVGWWNRRK